jgi:hypothetical protein
MAAYAHTCLPRHTLRGACTACCERAGSEAHEPLLSLGSPVPGTLRAWTSTAPRDGARGGGLDVAVQLAGLSSPLSECAPSGIPVVERMLAGTIDVDLGSETHKWALFARARA